MTENLGFICLQETQKRKYKNRFLNFISGGKNFHWVSQPPTGRSGGLLSGINLDMFQVESEMLGRYTVVMEITCKEDGNKWSLINVYGAAQAEDKDNFLTELAGCFHSAKYSIIAGGDYNIMRYSSEKSKGLQNTEEGKEAIKKGVKHLQKRAREVQQQADGTTKAFGFEMSPPASESLPKPSPTKMEGFTGFNYATGDAGIRNFTNGDITNPLFYQIGFFESTRSQLKTLLGGRKPLNYFLSKSLFVVGIGTMDLFPDYNPYWDNPENDNQTEVQHLISLYGEALTKLHAMGARKFGIINMGPVGCSPIVMRVTHGQDPCNTGMNNLAQEFNRALAPLLSDLRSKLRGFRYSLADFYGFTNATFANPSASGFTNTMGMCWQGYGTPCSNRTEFWYWDIYGYMTEHAANLTAAAFYGGRKFTTPFNFT
ncbi:hypothetical protein EJB05_30186, partial [Eragrostis curvula]